MSRFLYYFIIITMLANIVASVPKILLFESEKGAIISMIAASILGPIIVFIIIKLFNLFPGKTLPQMMKQYTPKWFAYPVLFYFFVCWYIAGLITIVTYVFLIKTFFAPETSIYIITLPFVIVISFGILMKSKSVAYMTEFVLVIFIPIIVFLLTKFYTNQKLDWDFIKISMTYINHFPSYRAFCASLYIFVGVANFIIFNKLLSKKQKVGMKQFIIIGLSGIAVLFTTYFLPIGYIGFDHIEELSFPWISTSDTVRMKYGIIERLIFIFILSCLGITFLTLLHHWHVSLKLLQSILIFKRLNWKRKNLTPYIFVTLFGIVAMFATGHLTEFQLFDYASAFFDTLPIFFTILIISLLLIKKGAKL
ncbi:GerAB/ArcD/ProY family transporter [Bacillus sp. FJAT-22090]|uniref:GerAB/ArcD/ProY family transporter n=1 Tax=Bacillus sp. FJAT-22090 TaxID=1581038 RepID=UPI0011A32EED|nr:GerAB/ArcD/ProY family transporter [Bacillus sp. FJAT-22090]